MKAKFKDERIEKRTNEIYAKLYLLILFLTICVAVFKWIYLTQNIMDFVLEIIATIGSVGYLIIRIASTKIPLFSSPDECIKEIQNSYRKTCFNICFQTYILGELVILFVLKKTDIACMYILIWAIPSIIYTFIVIKDGLLVWGSKKSKIKRIKSFKLNTVVASILFGFISQGKSLFKDNSFNPAGLIYVLIAAVVWGIPFYFIMKGMINKSEKIADNQLANDENEKS